MLRARISSPISCRKPAGTPPPYANPLINRRTNRRHHPPPPPPPSPFPRTIRLPLSEPPPHHPPPQPTPIPFTTPGKGVLTVEIGGFQGDWDLYVFENGGILAAAESDQVGGAPATEKIMVLLGAKKKVEIVACNWSGGPTASGHYMYKYKNVGKRDRY